MKGVFILNDELDVKKENKGLKKHISQILFCIVLIVITSIVTHAITINVTISSYLSKANSAYMIAKMSLIKNKLEDACIYDINENEMIEGAIKGYVSGLGDKNTQYLPQEDMK